MIGEKIKIGFDGSDVKRGLAGIMGGFGKLRTGIGRVTRQVGIGAARQMGASLFGTIVSGLRAIPNEIENMARLSKELDIMSRSTGIAKAEYLALRQAVSQASGLDANEAVGFLRDVSERLGEAFAKDGGYESAPGKAFRELGLSFSEFQGKNVAEQMKMISEGFTQYQKEKGFSAAMIQINELLGEVGKQMIPLFLDYEKGMIKARNQTAVMAKQLDETKDKLQTVFDIRQTFGRKFSEFSLGLLKVLGNSGFLAKINNFFDGLNIDGLANDINRIIESISEGVKKSGVFGYLMKKAGDLIAWIAEKFGGAIVGSVEKSITNSPMLKGIMGVMGIDTKSQVKPKLDSNIPNGKNYQNYLDNLFLGPASFDKGFDPKHQYEAFGDIENNTSMTNDLLRDIKQNVGVAKYA